MNNQFIFPKNVNDKSRNPLLNLLINYIPARSAPQILSIKVESTFIFSNFLIIGFCNSATNLLLEVISFLTVPPEIVFIKKFINH